ncbi:MAG: radical SAM protein [Spirochaetaceae bacterium 4572_59]|nr:MAG: radical SAM protein [Spirochaetaceae bacterium 4572_59]
MKEYSYKECHLCGRDCGVDRTKEIAFCGQSDTLRMAWAGLHFGEEPPVTGSGGSGTLFFSGCTLGCPFCQNWQISRNGMGRDISTEEFVEICRGLQNRGAENLNLVTPSHFIPSLVELLPLLKRERIDLPIVWNSSGQEDPGALDMLMDSIDIFLPDLKTLDPRVAREIYHFESYPTIADAALKRMIASRPLELDDRGVMKRGVLLRHLILPGEMESSRQILEWFAQNGKDRALLSLMSQYTPVPTVDFPDLKPDRYLAENEYEKVLEWLQLYDLEDGYIQELVTGNDWLPDFNDPSPFSSELSKPLWHWKEGYL